MSQAHLLVKALKELLKEQNITYKQVAQHLALSHASIKRMFATEQLTLERIDSICNFLGIELSDLLQKMQFISKRIMQLTYAQEQTIVSDPKLCLITICIINHWTFNQIIDYYKLTESECIRYLAKLDSIKIIELLPKNKIKLLISSRFVWLPNGPIQKFFQKYILADFVNSNFQHQDEKLICEFGMLTSESRTIFLKKLETLAEEFLLLRQQDVPAAFDKKTGTACVLMTRHWTPEIFKPLVKQV